MTPEARAARERKQKIFVAVGGVFLLIMLAIQLPNLLGGGDSAAAPTTPDAVQPAEPAGGTPVVLSGSTDQKPAVPGKLTSLAPFGKKNPFVQLVVSEDLTGVAAPAGDAKTPSGDGDSKKFSLGEKSKAPAVTIVSVNGERQSLEPGATFPSADPVFVLVSEQPGTKSVVVGVVGGAYAGGSKTTKLKVGKSLTLENTATGAKYRIKLVSVGSGDAPEQPAKPK